MSLRRQFLYVQLSLTSAAQARQQNRFKHNSLPKIRRRLQTTLRFSTLGCHAAAARRRNESRSEAELLRPKAGEKIPSNWSSGRSHNPIDKLAGAPVWSQITTGLRHAQRLLTPTFICRATLLAEQRMFSQSDRMLAASNITLASIEMSYIMGHLSKRRFDKVHHLEKARSAVPEHPLLDYVSSLVATDKAEEFAYLEKVYAKDQRHLTS